MRKGFGTEGRFGHLYMCVFLTIHRLIDLLSVTRFLLGFNILLFICQVVAACWITARVAKEEAVSWRGSGKRMYTVIGRRQLPNSVAEKEVRETQG